MARRDPQISPAERARERGVTIEAGGAIYHPDVLDPITRRPVRFPPTRSTLHEHFDAISDPDLGNTVRAGHELLAETRRALERDEPLPSYARDLRQLQPLDDDEQPAAGSEDDDEQRTVGA